MATSTDIHFNVDRTIAVCHAGTLNVTVFGPRPWSDASWNDYVQLLERLSHATPPIASNSLNYVSTAVPTAHQRRVANELGDRLGNIRGKRHAVLTESAIARAATNTVALYYHARFRTEMRAWHPRDHADALTWLREAVPVDPERALMLLRTAMSELGYEPRLIP